MTRISSLKDIRSQARSRKQFLSLRQGRVNTAKEARQTLVLQRNLQTRLQARLNSLFRKFLNTNLYLYKQVGVYEPQVAAEALREDLFPLMLSHYKRVSKAVWQRNEDKYQPLYKKEMIFGRNNSDLERFVNAWFIAHTPQLVNMSDDLAKRIANSIRDGRAADMTLDQIARKVSSDFRISRARAALIARTETHGVMGYANHEYHLYLSEKVGIKTVKKWVATSDDRTRSFHADANGQIREMEAPFDVGGAKMQHAGDPAGGAKNVINCRCVVVYVDPEDEVDGEVPAENPDIDAPKDLPFGEAHPDELKYHETADWAAGEAGILDLVKLMPATRGMKDGSGGAHFSPWENKIHMPKKYDGTMARSVTWRHEYGHAMENLTGSDALGKVIQTRLLANGVIDDDDIANMNSARTISYAAAPSVLKDKNALQKRKRALRKNSEYPRYRQESRWAAGKLGGDPAGDGDYFYAYGAEEFERRVYQLIDDGGGAMNSKFIETLFGKGYFAAWFKSNARDVGPKGTTINGFAHDMLMESVSSLHFDDGNDSLIRFLRGQLSDKLGSRYNKDEVLMFSDFVGSVSRNSFFQGHSDAYYARSGQKRIKGVTDEMTSEAWANYVSLLGGPNASLWRPLMEYYAPNTMRDFDRLYKGAL